MLSGVVLQRFEEVPEQVFSLPEHQLNPRSEQLFELVPVHTFLTLSPWQELFSSTAQESPSVAGHVTTLGLSCVQATTALGTSSLQVPWFPPGTSWPNNVGPKPARSASVPSDFMARPRASRREGEGRSGSAALARLRTRSRFARWGRVFISDIRRVPPDTGRWWGRPMAP